MSISSGAVTTTYDDPQIAFDSNGNDLDYSKELIGQVGFGPGIGGDFNIFGVGGYDGSSQFTVGAPNGNNYVLTSMKAKSSAGVQIVSAQLVANDIDQNSVLGYSLDEEVPGLTLSESGAYSFDPSNLSYQFLPTGETLEVVAPWTVEDEHGASDFSTLTITVTGTSDAPLTKGAVNGDGDTLTGELENPGNATGFALMEPVAGLTINGDGGYSFDLSAGSFDGLKAGQTSQVIANWKAFDENSVEINGAVLITVTGVNDAPVAVAAAAAVTEDDVLFSGQLVAPDPDQDAVVTFALADEETMAGLAINEDGGFSFDPANTAYQDVAQGADRVVVANWVATDELGAAGAGTLTITVTGVNDSPVAVTNSINVTEGGDPLPGTLVANDVDQGAVVTYALVENVAGLVVSGDGSFAFDPADAAYQALAQGESQEVVANWVATDDQGAKANGALTITVAGSNNSPVTNPFEGLAAAGQLTATDSDNGSSLVYSLNEAVEGLTINEDGSYGFDLSLPAYRSLRAGETLVVEAGWTATDNNEASTSSTLKLTLEGVNDTPEPVSATAAANEDSLAAVTGQLSATDADANAVLTYSLDAPVAGLTIDGNGAFSFELPSGSNQSLALGQTSEIVANWTVTDDAEATANGTLTITVNGANDAPVGVDASVEVPKGLVASGKTLVLDMNFGPRPVKATITLPDESEWRDGDIIDLMMPLNRENFKLSSPDFSPELLDYLENQLDIFGDFTMRGDLMFMPFFEFENEIRIGDLERFDLFVFGELDLFIHRFGDGDIEYEDPELRDLFEDSGFFTFDRNVFVDDRARLEDATSSITSGSLAATDVDQNSVLTFALDEPVAGLTLATNGDYTFDGNNEAYADLWEGDSREVVADSTVTDQHGATDSQKLTITVYGNGVNPAPVITITSGTDTVEQGSNWTDAGATADGGETVTASGTVDTNTAGTYTITYTATDEAGNVGTATRTVTVEDVPAQFVTLTVNQPSGGFIDYTAIHEKGATATITAIADSGNFFDGWSGDGSFTPLNADGSKAALLMDGDKTITAIFSALRSPVITSGTTGMDLLENSGLGSTVYTITASSDSGGLSYAIAGADASLLSVNSASGVVSLTANPDYETKNSYSFTVTASDAAGTSLPITVTFSITDVDETPPVITVISGTDTVEKGSTWTDAGAIADGGETVTASGTVDTSATGTYTITYTATDAAGNTGTATRTVTVVDTTADPYDTWASSFGLDPATDGAPTADPDGDGQNNLFEFTAGVVPNDALSRFHWRVEEDPDTPGQNRIVFSPRFDDRTYNVETSTTLQASDWIDFTGGSVSDDGDERTVTDPDTSDARKFYRLEIVKP